MSRYNSNWGSHDQLQDLRKANMVLHRELDQLMTCLSLNTCQQQGPLRRRGKKAGGAVRGGDAAARVFSANKSGARRPFLRLAKS